MLRGMSEWRVKQEIDRGRWIAELVWREGDTHGPSELVVRPADPERRGFAGISHTVLREINFRLDRLDELSATPRLAPVAVDPGELRRAAKDGLSDRYLALLAAAYVERAERRESYITRSLAEDVGKREGTIRQHLWQARKRGLMTGGSHGLVGGKLTAKARELLA